MQGLEVLDRGFPTLCLIGCCNNAAAHSQMDCKLQFAMPLRSADKIKSKWSVQGGYGLKFQFYLTNPLSTLLILSASGLAAMKLGFGVARGVQCGYQDQFCNSFSPLSFSISSSLSALGALLPASACQNCNALEVSGWAQHCKRQEDSAGGCHWQDWHRPVATSCRQHNTPNFRPVFFVFCLFSSVF